MNLWEDSMDQPQSGSDRVGQASRMLGSVALVLLLTGVGLNTWIATRSRATTDRLESELAALRESLDSKSAELASLIQDSAQAQQKLARIDSAVRENSVANAAISTEIRSLADQTLSRIASLREVQQQEAERHASSIASVLTALEAYERSTAERAEAVAAANRLNAERHTEAIAAVGAAAAATLEQLSSLANDWRQDAASNQRALAALDVSVKQALGKVYIEETPAEVLEAVNAAIGVWLPANPWKVAPGGTDDLRATLASIRAATPPGADAELAGPVRRLEWWADVLELEALSPNSVARVPSFIARARELEESAPFTVPEWAIERITVARRQAVYAAATGAAKAALGTSNDPATPTAEEALILITAAKDMWKENTLQRRELIALEDKLTSNTRKPLLNKMELDARLAALDEEYSRASKVTDAKIRLQLGLAVEAQAVVLLTEVPSSEMARAQAKVLELRKKNERQQNQIRDQDWLEYQAWALKHIRKSDTAIKASKGTFSSDTAAIRDALIWLTSVDRALLEPAIGQKFDEVWKSGWEAIKEEREVVLNRVSETRKHQLGEVEL